MPSRKLPAEALDADNSRVGVLSAPAHSSVTEADELAEMEARAEVARARAVRLREQAEFASEQTQVEGAASAARTGRRRLLRRPSGRPSRKAAAVAAAPDNPAVRFVRAIDYYELPSLFGKGKTARDDFQILLKQIDGEIKTPYVLDTETQQAIYLYAGKSFYQLSQYPQAKDAWQRGLKLDPNSALAVKIKAEQAKLN